MRLNICDFVTNKLKIIGIGGKTVAIDQSRRRSRGRVRQRHGGAAAQLPAELDPEGQAQARARLRIDGVFVAGELPPVRPVRRDGSPLRDFPKPAPPARSPEYLAYVRSYPCCSCPEEGASHPAEVPSEAHHQGRRGVGQKCSDFRCVPLCGLCHLDYTDNGTLPGRDRAAAGWGGDRLVAYTNPGEALPAELGERFQAHFGAEIIDERGVRSDFVFLHAELFNDDLLDAFFDAAHCFETSGIENPGGGPGSKAARIVEQRFGLGSNTRWSETVWSARRGAFRPCACRR